MAKINILDQDTINKIAAGEVVERPSSVVKELVENSIDAGATAVSVTISGGGTTQIRVTDNGCGFEREDLDVAFLKNTTSKIRCAEDLLSVQSLGFRGEALSSISSVSKLELITKTKQELVGTRYVIHGGVKQEEQEVGCPDGTTFVVNDLFYNTPVRRKFLKSAMTEAGYVNDVMERIALSNPGIAIKFTNNGKLLINTSGNGKLRDVIYGIYGRDIASELCEVQRTAGELSICGLIAKPVIARGNRNYENYFLNGRYIRNPLISKAIEEAYRGYMMQNKYPFTALMLQIPNDMFDVNVHPAKLEVRFTQPELIYEFVYQSIRTTVVDNETIHKTSLETQAKPMVKQIPSYAPEPFERHKAEAAPISISPSDKFQEESVHQNITTDFTERKRPDISEKKSEGLKKLSFENNVQPRSLSEYHHVSEESPYKVSGYQADQAAPDVVSTETIFNHSVKSATSSEKNLDDTNVSPAPEPVQLSFLSEEAKKEHRIIGQVFDTYWMVEYDDKLYIIDQHAAHERILYENMMEAKKSAVPNAQQLFPPLVISLNLREQEVLEQTLPYLEKIGYEIESFGGKEYKVSAIPAELPSVSKKEFLMEFLDSLSENGIPSEPESVYDKIASLSCKAAVKGNHKLSYEEASSLITQLMKLENPFHCPHGRPVTIELSKYEIEKKFKRVL